MTRIHCLLAVGLGFCLLVGAGWADILHLRDGRQISGSFVSGDHRGIRFQAADGITNSYAREEIGRIEFGQSLAAGSTHVHVQAVPGTTASVPLTPAPVSGQSTVAVSGDSLLMPVGTRIVARLLDGVHSSVSRPGDEFRCELEEDLVANGRLIASRGSDCRGRLVQISAVTTGVVTQPVIIERREIERDSPATLPKSTRAAGTSRTPEPGDAARETPHAIAPGEVDQVGRDTPHVSGRTTVVQPGVAVTTPVTTVPSLTLALTQIEINGRWHNLAGLERTTVSETVVRGGVADTRAITVLDVNRGAVATSVLTGVVTQPAVGVGVDATGTPAIIYGSEVRVPSRSVIEFQLREPLRLDFVTVP